jgi:hypothetical protein
MCFSAIRSFTERLAGRAAGPPSAGCRSRRCGAPGPRHGPGQWPGAPVAELSGLRHGRLGRATLWRTTVCPISSGGRSSANASPAASWRSASIPPSLESARTLLSGVFGYQRRMHFLSEFMPKVDGGTMHYAIEARAPFLDHKVWEFAAALPPEVRFHGGRLKAVLREIVRRRVGPGSGASARSRGSRSPSKPGWPNRWSGLLDRLRESTLLEEHGWIRRGALDAPLRDAARQAVGPRPVVASPGARALAARRIQARGSTRAGLPTATEPAGNGLGDHRAGPNG